MPVAPSTRTARTGRTRAARTDVRAPWGLRFSAVVGATFHVVLHGACWLLTEGADPLELGPGDVVFLREGGAHALADTPETPLTDFRPERADPDSPIGHVRVEGPGAHAVLLCGAYQLDRTRPHPLMKDLPELLHLPARGGAELGHLVGLLAAELDRDRPGRDGIVPSLVDAMLLYVLRTWAADGRADAPGWARALADSAVGQALRDIHARPSVPWTVEQLAARAGLSRSVFAQRFTALVGEPPVSYLTWWRMTSAGRMLRESDAPLRTVAEQVGYTSEFAFAKAFKRAYGKPPGTYRRTPTTTPTRPTTNAGSPSLSSAIDPGAASSASSARPRGNAIGLDVGQPRVRRTTSIRRRSSPR
ncbi:AraC family transcriptional regulator [Actinomadura oligospora]|uniref:AraC family transcriptional regulator n=1 Tax=Actinomadura oligospora TaxID=111804 RepID=UPI0007E8DD07|nr:AraC family transcriptional regulator [Actinomadura oligospora]